MWCAKHAQGVLDDGEDLVETTHARTHDSAQPCGAGDPITVPGGDDELARTACERERRLVACYGCTSHADGCNRVQGALSGSQLWSRGMWCRATTCWIRGGVRSGVGEWGKRRSELIGERTGAWRALLAFSNATSWYHEESAVGSAGIGGLLSCAFSIRLWSCSACTRTHPCVAPVPRVGFSARGGASAAATSPFEPASAVFEKACVWIVVIRCEVDGHAR